MHQDRMLCAWSKWLEALELFDDGLIDRHELSEAQREAFAGVARMATCRRIWETRAELLDESYWYR